MVKLQTTGSQLLQVLVIIAPVLGAPWEGASNAAAARRDAVVPAYPHDDVPNCSWWFDSDGSWTCQDVYDVYGVTPKDFAKWNPSVGAACILGASRSFCVEAVGGPLPTPSASSTKLSSTFSASMRTTFSLTSTSTKTTTAPPTGTTSARSTTTPSTSTTKPGNGVSTPLPVQPEMVPNCNRFYWVKRGDTCDSIAQELNVWVVAITLWNPKTMADCSGLWANAWACVGIIDRDQPTTISLHPTPTTPPANGVSTPLPTQPEMVTNCKSFYWVKPGDTCDSIARELNVWVVAITLWNPKTMADCSGLWANAWACVAVL